MRIPPSSRGGSRSPQESLEATFLLSDEQRRAATQVVVDVLQERGPIPREEILSAVDLARGVWQAEPEGASRSRALKGMATDVERLQGSDLPAITSHLVESMEARQSRLKLFSRLGLGLALGGFMGAMTGQPVLAPIGMVLGIAGAATAGYCGLARQRTPEQDTLVRLNTYAQVALEARAEHKRYEELAQETRALVAALGAEKTPQIRHTPEGVTIGSVFLPRKV